MISDVHTHEPKGLGIQTHSHDLGYREHWHNRRNGKTYFRNELRSDGVPVRCEGHWSMELGVAEEWAYL